MASAFVLRSGKKPNQTRISRKRAILAAAIAVGLSPLTAAFGANSATTFQGTGTSVFAPVTGAFSTGFSPTAVTAGGSATLELDFNTTAASYVATDDLAGALLLNEIQLNYGASGAGTATIAAGAGNSLNFVANGTVNPTLLQDGTAASIITAPIAIGATGGATPINLVIGGVGAGADTISGGITSNNSAANGVIFNGNNTVTLSGSNSYGGSTTLTTGNLILDFSQAASPAAGVINAVTNTPLALGGGTLVLNGGSSAVTQSFSSTTLTGGSSIGAFTNTGSGVTLNLGAITRNANGGSIDVSTASGTVVKTTSLNNANGILGGWATAGGADWATISGLNATNPIVAYAAYTTFITSGTTATAPGNYALLANTGTTTLAASESVNSLKITGTGGTLALGANNLTFNGSTGGLLYAPGATGTNTQTISGTGNIGAGSGAELIVSVQAGASNTLTISAPILTANNGSLTKTGGGTLVLSGANTYTGGTVVDAGVLKISGSVAALGTPPAASYATVNPGGTLDVNGVVTPGTITISGFGTSANVGAITDSGNSLTNTGLSNVILAGNASIGGPSRLDETGTMTGNGFNLVKVGANYMAENGSMSNVNNLTINNGMFEFANATNNGATTKLASITINPAGTLEFFYTGATADTYAQAITLSGGQIGCNGGNGPTLSGPITLAGASNTIGGGSGAVSSSLTITGTVAGPGALVTTGYVSLNSATGNIYTGGTTVSSGTLSISNTSNSATGPANVSVGNSATFILATGASIITGSVSTGTSSIVTNAGTIGGSVTLGGSALLTNNGTVAGNVTLGNSAVLGTGATTSGKVTGTVSGPGSGATATIAPGGVYTGTANGTIGTLTIGGINAGPLTTLAFDFNSSGASNDEIIVLGSNTFIPTGTVPVVFGQAPVAANTYHLLSFTSTTTPTTSEFSVPSSPNPRITYTPQINSNGNTNGYFLDLFVSGSGVAITTVFNKAVPITDGTNPDWTNTANWSNGVPGLPGDNATLNNAAPTATTIDLNGQQHVGTLSFGNSGIGAYTLAAGTGTGNALNLDTGTSAGAVLNNTTNANVISAPVVLLNATTVNITTNTSLTISGALSGGATQGITLPAANGGTLALSGPNTFSGGVIVSGGTLAVNSAAALGTGTLVLNNGATIDNTSGAAVINSNTNAQTWAGSFTFKGTQPLNLGTGAVTLTTTPTVTVTGNTLTVGGVVSGGFGLTVNGTTPGTLLLSNAGNNYTGATIINGGILQVSGAGSTAGVLAGTPSITVNNGGELLVTNTGNDTLGFTAGKEALIINSGGSVLNNGGGGRVTIQNNVTMTGGTLGGNSTSSTGAYSINVGSIVATSDASGNPATISGTLGTQSVIPFNVTRGTFYASSPTSTAPDLLISAPIVIFGAGNGFTKTGNGIMNLAAANTFTGTAAVNAGELELTGSLVAGVSVTVAASAILAGNGTAGGTAAISGILGPSAPSTTVPIGKPLTITGALTLAASSQYSVVLSAASAGSNPAGYDQVVYGTTATITAGSTLVVNDAAFATGANLGTSGQTFWIMDGSGPAGTTGDAVSGTFGSTVIGTSGTHYTVNYNVGSDPLFTNHDVELVAGTVVPEPASLGLLGVGALGLLTRRRRRTV